jgi:hypothetical protein
LQANAAKRSTPMIKAVARYLVMAGLTSWGKMPAL